MSETRTYQGATYQRNAPGEPWVLVPNIGAPSTIPGAFVPPDPARVAEKQREQARQDAADARTAAAAQRSTLEWTATHNSDGSKKAAEDAPPPGDITKTGKAYYDSLPDSYKGTVRQLLSNHLVLSSFAMAKPYYQAAINAASRIDPSYDPSLAPVRSTAMKDFTGAGKASAAVGAVNRLAANLQELKSISDKMGGPNLGFAPLNKLVAGTQQEFEPELKRRYDALLPEIATQFDLVMKSQKGGGATVSGIAEAMKGLDRATSQDERNAAFQEIAKAVHGAIEPIKDQWDSAYGGTKAPPMWISKQAGNFFASLDPENADTYGGNDWRGLPGLKGDALPWEAPVFGGGPPTGGAGGAGGAGGPPTLGGGGGGGVSPLVSGGGGPGMTAATGSTKNVFDPETAAALNALVQKQRPYAEAAAYVQSKGFLPPSPGDYAAALGWQKINKNTPYNAANPTRTEATTGLERAASSPVGSYFGGAADALTAGYSDELAGGAAARVGGDYTQARDAFNAQKNIQAAENPTASLAGNVTGGIMSAVAPEAILSRAAPGALAFGAAKLGKFAPAVTDAAYGAAYGSGENNDNRLLGAAEGAVAAPIFGQGARMATRGLANIVAPPEGAFGPSYAQGVFPTIGQRFGKSGLAGRIINTGEQALQSVPVLGSMVARARQIPRDAFQTGAFNDALSEIGQQLPPNTGPGTDAHSFASGAFGKAYDAARSGMQFLPDAPYQADAQAFAKSLDNGTLDESQVGQVLQRINTAVNSRLSATGGALPGDAYKAAASDLAETQRQWSKTDPLKANALGDYLTIFDNAARRNSDPNAVAMLDQADRGYAKLVRVQRASELGGVGKEDGTFTPNQMSSAVKQSAGGVRSGPYLRGDALSQDYANAGRGLSDTLPNSGTAERLYTGQVVAGGAGSMLGAPAAIAAHPGSLAPFALYAPGVNKAVARAIAPRQYTLPPNLAAPINTLGAKINNVAPLAGRLALPAALEWWEGR